MTKLIDIIFICSSVIFNILVSGLYIVTKLGDTALTQVLGVTVVSLIVPFTVTLLGYVRAKEKKKDANIQWDYSLLSLSGISAGLCPQNSI